MLHLRQLLLPALLLRQDSPEELRDHAVQPGVLVGPPAAQVGAVAAVAGAAEDDVRALLALRGWLGPANHSGPICRMFRGEFWYTVFRFYIQHQCRLTIASTCTIADRNPYISTTDSFLLSTCRSQCMPLLCMCKSQAPPY